MCCDFWFGSVRFAWYSFLMRTKARLIARNRTIDWLDVINDRISFQYILIRQCDTNWHRVHRLFAAPAFPLFLFAEKKTKKTEEKMMMGAFIDIKLGVVCAIFNNFNQFRCFECHNHSHYDVNVNQNDRPNRWLP